MQEKPVCHFRKMIAESNSFIIGADYDIHKVVFTLIITTIPITFSFSFLELQSHLIIAITNLRTLAIYRLPSLVRLLMFSPRQLQILTPKMTSIIRYTQRRFKQLIFNQNTQFTFFNHRMIFISQGIIHLCIILSYRTLIKGKTISSIRRRQFLTGFCHHILRFYQCRYHQQQKQNSFLHSIYVHVYSSFLLYTNEKEIILKCLLPEKLIPSALYIK